MSIKNVLFDLDGTIIDSKEGIINSVLISLKDLGIEENDHEKLIEFLGPPLFESYTKIYQLNYEDYKKALDVFHAYYVEKGIFECEIYRGMEKFLSSLKEKGFKLYVATSKPEKEAVRVLKHLNLDKYFEFIGGSDGDHNTKRSTKKDVIKYVLETNKIDNLSEVIMVGDRSHDIVGAKETSIKVIACTYGYGKREEFEKFEADYIIDNLDELESLIIELSKLTTK